MEKFNNSNKYPCVHATILNIDTDMIIPKQFLKTIKRTGLGKNLFYEMRYDEKDVTQSKILFLIKNLSMKSKILLTGKKFWLWFFSRACTLGLV